VAWIEDYVFMLSVYTLVCIRHVYALVYKYMFMNGYEQLDVCQGATLETFSLSLGSKDSDLVSQLVQVNLL